ncbi:enoyl-CoA hydratase/isomerase family protein [Streptomyces sp. NPDC051218]|uniref:enoyl-CoA hydratase/isomerase family protein n=1 Tax=Streptomyces sp. NPDC051218 TaxID=3365645 RepID=UPI0037BCE756
MTTYETLLVERAEPGVAVLRLNRPEQLNALNVVMFQEIREACAALHADDDVRAVILTGAGRGFCAGYDLEEAEELAALTPADMLARQDLAHAAIMALRTLRQPVIAAVPGPAIGGGLSLALAADIRLAASAARFSAAFVRLGLSGGDMGCSWHLPRVVGVGTAAELMFTGRTVEAAEALALGLANSVVVEAELIPKALAMARAIAAHSPFGIALTKRALYANLDAPSLYTALEVESRGQAFATRDPDFPKALASVRAQLLRRAADD